MADAADEIPDDIDVYQLAEQVADGNPCSTAGAREIARELLRVRPLVNGHARDLAMLAWFVSRGATGAGQWPGDPDDFQKQTDARATFDSWWSGR